MSSEPDAVSRIGQGLVSCRQVPELYKYHGLRCVCLHGNNITSIDGIQHLTKLQELNLSSNSITNIQNLHGLVNLTSLNLASNKLQAISGLDGLSNLTHLNVSYNRISNITGLAALQGPNCKLRMLNLKHNQLSNLQSFAVLIGCVNLRDLSIQGNPLCQLPNYRQAIVSVLPQITNLDNMTSTEAMHAPYDMHAAQQLAAMRLQAFESPPQTMQISPAKNTVQRVTPQIDAALSTFQRRQKQQQPQHSQQQPQPHPSSSQPLSPAAAQQPTSSHDVSSSAAAPGTAQHPGQGRQPANWQQGPSRKVSRGTDATTDDTDMSYQLGSGRIDQEPRKIYLMDAGVQTMDYTPVVKKLQQDCDQLKQQLVAMTGEVVLQDKCILACFQKWPACNQPVLISKCLLWQR